MHLDGQGRPVSLGYTVVGTRGEREGEATTAPCWQQPQAGTKLEASPRGVALRVPVAVVEPLQAPQLMGTGGLGMSPPPASTGGAATPGVCVRV